LAMPEILSVVPLMMGTPDGGLQRRAAFPTRER
jgi:hypothetical protein